MLLFVDVCHGEFLPEIETTVLRHIYNLLSDIAFDQSLLEPW